MTAGPKFPKAVVFFARDFLADEFARLGQAWPELKRIYIVVNDAERDRILAADADGHVFNLSSIEPLAGEESPETGFNIDRHLRYLGETELRQVVGAVNAVCETILSSYRVAYYLDEPVSGYPNWEFNRRFRTHGALCLHFQASWVPSYLFFTSDPAQLEPVPLRIVSDGRDVIDKHIKDRAEGKGRPLYVLGYSRLGRRALDMVTTALKGAYRVAFRGSAAYIDRDPSAHFLHARALAGSLQGRYHKSVDSADKIVVFPLHYEPEAVLLYMGRFRRQEEIAARLLDSLPLGWKLVLKEHPSQPGALYLDKWADLRRSQRIVLLRGDFPLHDLLPRKPVVVSIGSTFALEAALAGCRVGLLGGVHFAGAPGIHMLDRPEDWLQLLQSPEPSAPEISVWYAGFLDTYCFRGTVMRGRTNFGNLSELIRALARARQETATCG